MFITISIFPLFRNYRYEFRKGIRITKYFTANISLYSANKYKEMSIFFVFVASSIASIIIGALIAIAMGLYYFRPEFDDVTSNSRNHFDVDWEKKIESEQPRWVLLLQYLNAGMVPTPPVQKGYWIEDETS